MRLGRVCHAWRAATASWRDGALRVLRPERKYGKRGSSPVFDCPSDVASLPGGGVCVADTRNNQLQIFSHVPAASAHDAEEAATTKLPAAATSSHFSELTIPRAPRVLGGQGDGPGQFSLPCGAACDSAGHLYVADAGNNRVVKLRLADGAPLGSIGSLGRSGRSVEQSRRAELRASRLDLSFG